MTRGALNYEIGMTAPKWDIGLSGRREHWVAAGWGAFVTAGLGLLIVVGSRDLAHFDAALVGYTFASLFATFGVTYRYSMWLQRPPTGLYWKRGWQIFFRPEHLLGNLSIWLRRVVGDFVFNQFIFRRNHKRGLAHWMILWGCALASAVTFPLVFGWINFGTLPGRLDWYRAYVFGFPTVALAVHSWVGFVIFHALDWAAILVIAGVILAVGRRMTDRGEAAVQEFGHDMLPLVLLFAVSVTGLMLTVSYTWMQGFGYDFLALLHAITVIFTLLWLPFGKFFHIFQRPAQLGVSFYQDAGARGQQARCVRCNGEYASQMHVDDLIEVERRLGYAYQLGREGHYQHCCPACRRALMAMAQGRAWGR